MILVRELGSSCGLGFRLFSSGLGFGFWFLDHPLCLQEPRTLEGPERFGGLSVNGVRNHGYPKPQTPNQGVEMGGSERISRTSGVQEFVFRVEYGV